MLDEMLDGFESLQNLLGNKKEEKNRAGRC